MAVKIAGRQSRIEGRNGDYVHGLQPDTGPYVPEVPFAAMASQLPPCAPRYWQASSRRGPTIPATTVALLDLGVNWQASVFSKQLHALSLGVGGSVLLARNVEFCVGQLG